MDKASDFGSGHVVPVASNSLLIVGGGVATTSGVGLCTTGLGCTVGGGMVVVGISSVTEGVTGLSSYINGQGGVGFNPGRYAAKQIFPDYGELVYSGFDIALTFGAAASKVPLAMGVADGLNRPTSMFGVMQRQIDNPTLVPKFGYKLPSPTTEGLLILDLSGKGNDFYNRWRVGQMSKFNGSDIRRFILGCILIFGAGGFWALVIAGFVKYIFDLEEVFALRYIGGGVFFLFSIWGVVRYSRDLKHHIR